MDILIQYFKINFYLDVLSLFVALIALRKYFINKKAHSSLKYFGIYFLSYSLVIILIFANGILALINGKQLYSLYIFQFHCDFFFTIIEFYVFALYFKIHINKAIFIISNYLFIIYTSIAYGIILNTENLYNDEVMLSVFTFQSIILLALTISYFSNFLNQRNQLFYFKQPSFWIAAGLLLFVLSTLPYSLISNYLLNTKSPAFDSLFPIFYIFYIILFIMIIKALSLKDSSDKIIIPIT